MPANNLSALSRPRPRGFTLRRSAQALALALALGAATACSDEPAVAREVPVAREIRDLVAALKPLSASAGQAVQDDWYRRRDITLSRLRKADVDVGVAAREALDDHNDSPVGIRVGLLDVAAHADPVGTTPLLEALFTTYGPELMLRREAAALLGKHAPARAVELIEPVILQARRTSTYPPGEFMLLALLEAKRSLDQPVSEVLTTLALDIFQEDRVRQLAVQELGTDPTPRGIKALEAVLIESTGNAFLRREAAQSMLRAGDIEERCKTFREVFDREADENFRVFLADVINKHCR